MAAVATLVAAGCTGGAKSAGRRGTGTSTSGPTVASTVPSSTSTTSARSTVAGATCLTPALSLTYLGGQGAAGSGISSYEFTNNGAETCTLTGFPGVSVLDGKGQVVQHSATRSFGPGTTNQLPVLPVTLPGGGHGRFLLLSTDTIPNPDCPTAYRGVTLQVYPPGNTAPIDQTFTGVFCDLVVGPVQPTTPGVVADCTAPGNAANDTTTEPASIVLACADNGIGFQDLSWTSWTSTSAKGVGQLWEKDCVPNCRQGTFLHYGASVTLTTVVASINGPVFSVITAGYPGGGPKGEASGRFSLPVPPPPTPTCSARQLKASVTSSAAKGKFSEEYVQFTNVSSQGCHMEGFPGFDLLDSSGHSIANASRGCPWAGKGLCPTSLDYINVPAHNGTAFFGFVWQSTPDPGQTCPESASVLVTPPNAFDHLTLPLRLAACGQPPPLGIGTVGYAI